MIEATRSIRASRSGNIDEESNNTMIEESNENDEVGLISSVRREVIRIKKWDMLFASCLLTILLTGVIVGSFLLIDEGRRGSSQGELNLVSRQVWSAQPPSSKMAKLKLPAAGVLFIETNSTTCRDQSRCSQLLKDLQKRHMAQTKEPDIPYNFLLTPDGSVFEGRGWGFRGTFSELTLAFIGNYKENPTTEQIQSAKLFLDLAISEDKLQTCCDISVWTENSFLINLALTIRQSWKECQET